MVCTCSTFHNESIRSLIKYLGAVSLNIPLAVLQQQLHAAHLPDIQGQSLTSSAKEHESLTNQISIA